MRFVNKSKNTVFIEDINRHVPYKEDEEQEMSLDDAKKSKGFRQLVMQGYFFITQAGNSVFEQNLLRAQPKPPPPPAPPEPEPIEEEESEEEPEENEEEEVMEEPKVRVPEFKPAPACDATGIKVCIRGHIYDAGGYAKVNRNMAFGLDRLGVEVALDPVNAQKNDLNEAELRCLAKFSKKLGREAIQIDSMIPTFSGMGMGKYKILYTTIESETVPKQFVDACKCYHEIWVTSDFCKRVLEREKDVKAPIYVFPDTVDTNLYNETASPYLFEPALKNFVFGSVFGWSYRKGYDLLLKAYLQEFRGDEPVSLLIVSRFSGSSKSDVIRETIGEFIRKHGGSNPPHIARCSKVIPEHQMPSIYRACDAYVLFSRGEGFGLPYCEASLCGVPVLATNTSGQAMFLNKDNASLLEIDQLIEMQAGMMHIHYWDGQKFPALTNEDTIMEARKLMRRVYQDHKAAVRKNRKLQRFVSDNYNINAVCSNMKNRLADIWSKLK